uniref:Uncharacterized protein n=1 Tax=Meloidogyne incognita TaxID=6306 RepID=A0A914MQJ5_MELIC
MSSSKQSSLFGYSSTKTSPNSQPNSPADSAIGTASDSMQSPPPNNLFSSPKRPIPLPRIATLPSPQPSLNPKPNTDSSYNQAPPRPPKKIAGARNFTNKRRIGLSVPILERIVCERDFEKIIKETEILSAGPETSQKEIIAESRLSRECLLPKEKEDEGNAEEGGMLEEGIVENKRYYLFDPLRHEYRLYYAREVRLRSETNLNTIGLDEDKEISKNEDFGKRKIKLFEKESKTVTETPKRRHSAGASARIRRPVPPPNKIQQTSMNELKINANVGQNLTTNPIQNRNETEQKRVFQPLPLGAFERNTNMRKSLQQFRSTSDLPRRTQWSGNAKRSAAAVALKQQQQRLLNANNSENKKKIEEVELKIKEITSSSPPPIVVTNQILKDLIRPLNPTKNEIIPEPSNINCPTLVYDSKSSEEPLVVVESKQLKRVVEGTGNNNVEQQQSFWSKLCGKQSKKELSNNSKNRRKLIKEQKQTKKWTEFQCLLAWLLVPLLLFSGLAAIAIIIVIYNL